MLTDLLVGSAAHDLFSKMFSSNNTDLKFMIFFLHGTSVSIEKHSILFPCRDIHICSTFDLITVLPKIHLL